LAKGGIAPRLFDLPGGSIELAVWLQFASACFGWVLTPKSPVRLGGQGPPSNNVS